MKHSSLQDIQFSGDGTWDYCPGTGIGLRGLLPIIKLADGTMLQMSDASASPSGEFGMCWKWPNGLSLTVQFSPAPGGIQAAASMTNQGVVPRPILDVCIIGDGSIQSTAKLDRALINGSDMNGGSGYVEVGGSICSTSVLGLTHQQGDIALLLGLMDVRHMQGDFLIKEGTRLSVSLRREGIELLPGETLALPSLRIATGQSLAQLLNQYAADSGELMGARRPPLHTGWCSWYTYYGTETVEDVLHNVESLRQSPMARNLKTIQIDDGWNYTAPGAPRNWGDWQAGYKFPNGMKDTADRIKAAGFQPGLWLAPFSIDPASDFFRQHPDLLVQDAESPKLFWECYGLDLTHPGAIDYVQDTFNRVFNQWGFTYIKIDFLLHAIQPGRRRNQRMTTYEVLRRGLEAIRSVAGEDNFILTCGCPMGPAVGVCDAMRIGLDVSHRWYLPMNLANWPWGNCSIYSGARHVVGRQWMDRNWWQNDPDCLVVNHDGTAGERRMFSGEGELGKFVAEPRFGLTDEEAAFWCRLVWLSGGLGMIGENIATLRQDRLALMQRAFPPNDAPAQVVDSYSHPEVNILRASHPQPMLGIFNLSESTQTVRLPRRKSGLGNSTKVREWLTGEVVALGGEDLVFPQLAPRSGRVWIAD